MSQNDCLIREPIVNFEPYIARVETTNGLPGSSALIPNAANTARIGLGLYKLDVTVTNMGAGDASGSLIVYRTPFAPGTSDPSPVQVSSTTVSSLGVGSTVKISVPAFQNQYVYIANSIGQPIQVAYYYHVDDCSSTGPAGPATSLSLGAGTGTIDAGAFGGFGWLENFLRASMDFNTNLWVYNGVTFGGYTVNGPTNEQTGNTAFDAVQINAGTLSSHGIYQDANSSPPSASTTWTLSVWARSVSGTVPLTLRLDSWSVTGTPSTANLTTSWQRVSVTQTFPSDSVGTVRAIILNGTKPVCLWGAQLNKGASPGIFYPTGRNEVINTAGVTGHYGWVFGAGASSGDNQYGGAIKIFSTGAFGQTPLQILSFGQYAYRSCAAFYGGDSVEAGHIAVNNGLQIRATKTIFLVGPYGYLQVNEGSYADGLYVSFNPTLPTWVVRTGSGQTANGLEVRTVTNKVVAFIDKDGCIGFDKVFAATAGDVTINAPSGNAIIAAGQSSVTVTNSLVTTSSHIVATVQTADMTLKTVIVTPAVGSFVITGNAAAMTDTTVRWTIIQ